MPGRPWKAMATTVGRLLLPRPGPGGGARWSEFFCWEDNVGCRSRGKRRGAGPGGARGALVKTSRLLQTCPRLLQGGRTRACPAKSPALELGRKVQHFPCQIVTVWAWAFGSPVPSRPLPNASAASFPPSPVSSAWLRDAAEEEVGGLERENQRCGAYARSTTHVVACILQSSLICLPAVSCSFTQSFVSS